MAIRWSTASKARMEPGSKMRNTAHTNAGFTLIELSIVLVIIGLIVGGILSGQDLINAARIRAQISQMEKYQTAVHAFQGKYGYLPGDIPDPQATNFGFWHRGAASEQGDGDGILMGNCGSAAAPLWAGDEEHECSWTVSSGTASSELGQMWVDLSTAHLIDAGISGAWASSSDYSGMRPTARIGQNNYVYTFSKGGINYFAVSTITNIGWTIESTTNPGLTVQQAYNIDSKMDDGMPQSGSVTACYVNYDVVQYASVWAAGGLQQGAPGGEVGGSECAATTNATPYAGTDCFDNNNTAGPETYSLSKNANALNCALSFRFQ